MNKTWNIHRPGTDSVRLRGTCECLRLVQQPVDVDKSQTEGDNVLAAADLRPAEKSCSPAVDGGDR